MSSFVATPAFTHPPLVQSVRPCGSSSALDRSMEALERHPPSLVLLSSQRKLVARARLLIAARKLFNILRGRVGGFLTIAREYAAAFNFGGSATECC